MRRGNPFILKLSYLAFLLGVLLVGLEYLLTNLFKTTLCPTSGCLIAEELLLLSKKHLLTLALLFYTAAIILLFFYQKTWGTFFRNLLLYLLTAGLVGEAYLIVFLLIHIAEPCWFCLGVSFITLLGTTSVLLYLRTERLSSFHFLLALFFGSLSLSFGLYFSSPPPLISKEDPLKKGSLILIHSNQCPACKEIIEEVERFGLKLEKRPLSQAFPLVKSLNLKSLPCLLEVKEEGIEIFIGYEAVRKRLHLEWERNPCVENSQEGGLCAVP